MRYRGRLNAMGFVDDIQNVMLNSDLLVMRASPNSVMEAVALNKPVILFGQLAGQEFAQSADAGRARPRGILSGAQAPAGMRGEARRRRRRGDRADARQPARLRAGDAAADTAKLIDEFVRPLDARA